jgi:hypothetical protein
MLKDFGGFFFKRSFGRLYFGMVKYLSVSIILVFP